MLYEVSGVFENASNAEFALMRMRELGINLHSYRIRPLHQDDPKSPPVLAADNSAMSEVSMFSNPYTMPIPPIADGPSESKGPDVALHVTVNDSETQLVAHVLTHMHGAQIATRIAFTSP